MRVPFNKPFMTGNELEYIKAAHANSHLAGDGPFTRRCHDWIGKYAKKGLPLLTHSCTAALEMSALLLDIQPGDEIIMPSFTFVSTANSFVLRGGVPIFVDIRNDTLNINESLIKNAISDKTKAILPVHYAGVACEMDTIMKIAKNHNLAVVEDAAQGLMANYKGKPLGSIGDIGTFSFHETKNIISGEGGAIIVNRKEWYLKAEVIREKGTDRNQFFRGQVDKYTWQDIGSSYLPGELVAAFLWAQFEQAEEITSQRKKSWNYYHQSFTTLEQQGLVRRPKIPTYCEHNAHIYYVILNPSLDRTDVISKLTDLGINAVFHYVPLHSSPAGKKLARISGSMENTETLSARLIRLPLWVGITEKEQDMVVQALQQVVNNSGSAK